MRALFLLLEEEYYKAWATSSSQPNMSIDIPKTFATLKAIYGRGGLHTKGVEDAFMHINRYYSTNKGSTGRTKPNRILYSILSSLVFGKNLLEEFAEMKRSVRRTLNNNERKKKKQKEKNPSTKFQRALGHEENARNDFEFDYEKMGQKPNFSSLKDFPNDAQGGDGRDHTLFLELRRLLENVCPESKCEVKPVRINYKDWKNFK